MIKYKNISGSTIRFDLNGKEKIVEPGHSFQAEENDYLTGAAGHGLLEAEDQAEAEIKIDPPKNTGK